MRCAYKAQLNNILNKSTIPSSFGVNFCTGSKSALENFHLFVYRVGSINTMNFDMSFRIITSKCVHYILTEEYLVYQIKESINRKEPSLKTNSFNLER